MKKIISISSILILVVLITFALLHFFEKQNIEQNDIEYIVTINGIRIPIDYYKLYLRTNIYHFENIGVETGEDVWRISVSGISAYETAKNHALESIILVSLTNMQANIELNESQIEMARIEAQNIFDSFNNSEKEIFSFETVLDVKKNIILYNATKEYLTRNYIENERDEIFNNMFRVWRENAVIERNIYVWNSIDVVEFKNKILEN
ncbi:MAG: hypothetical protein FWF57_09195 [Defluviitaleaceae bacterium]|nr:hypothetical protein [Defluviitaleaceae bacterium]